MVRRSYAKRRDTNESDIVDALKALGAALTARGPAADALRVRMQQVTGAVAAKAQEDTAFYRETRLLSMNEVGGEPDDGALDTASFHALMTQRAEEMPHGMVLTSSHDTKRSEDARTMLIAATHAPAAFDAWMARCAAQAPEGLDPGTEWYLSQSRLALGNRNRLRSLPGKLVPGKPAERYV
mgnify:CR=1 FL=1